MAFAPTDSLRILRHLELPRSSKDRVLEQMAAVDSVEETEIKNLLTALDTLRTQLATVRGDVNSALIRADVLEWEAGKRSRGIETEYHFRRVELANLLGIEWDRSLYSQTRSLSLEVWHG